MKVMKRRDASEAKKPSGSAVKRERGADGGTGGTSPTDTAIVYVAGRDDVWRLRKSVASVRRVGVASDIFVLTLGEAVSLEDGFMAAQCKAVVPVDGILERLGFSCDGWDRSQAYGTLARLAIPLVPELAAYGRALYVGCDVLVLRDGFSDWLTHKTQGFEVVGAAGAVYTGTVGQAYVEEADRCFPPGDRREQMTKRIWSENPLGSRMHFNPGVCLWDLALIRQDVAWYSTRVKWFWELVRQGHMHDLSDAFVGVFMDAAATVCTAMNATSKDVGFARNAIAFSYGDAAAKNIPGCEFNKAASAMGLFNTMLRLCPQGKSGLEAAVSSERTMPQCKAGRLAVVHITDGNKADCQRLEWSLRSLARYSGLAFDSFVLTPEGANRPDVEHEAPRVLEHGCVSYISDIGKILGDMSIGPAGWNRAWPFVVLYRLGIPLHPAFAGYDRILYLDTDTLVLSNRVDGFISADLTGYELGGVVDTVQEEHDRIRRNLDFDLKPEFAKKVYDRYGDVLRLRPYVNAGVLLWNMPEIRKDIPWYRERLGMFWEAECRGRFGFLDQDFVNSMMSVDSRFSMTYNWFTRSNVEPDHCVIRHYCGHQYARMHDTAVSVGIVAPDERVI